MDVLTCSFTNNQVILNAVDRSSKIVFALKSYTRFDHSAVFFTTKTTEERSGMGLHICRKIIDKHQGRLQVESRAGHIKFSIWFPVEIA